MIDFNRTTLPLPPFSWCVSLLLEGGLIILGNALTMAVFWRRRFTLKRTTYLLINLAFADLLVGVSVIATGAIGIFMTTSTQSVLPYLVVNSANIFTTGSSIFSLTIVAVERAHAIVKPLKHRTTKTRYYFNAIRLVWVMATLAFILGMLYAFSYLPTLTFVFGQITLSACLLIICLSYTTIWWFTSMRSRQFLQRHQQNKKLAQTLFIVTFFSLVAWFPGQVLVMTQTTNDLNTGIINAVWSLEFANSLVNPFVYALRMPEFRREVKVLLCKRGDQIEDVIPAGDARGVTLISIENLLQSAASIHLQITGAQAKESR